MKFVVAEGCVIRYDRFVTFEKFPFISGFEYFTTGAADCATKFGTFAFFVTATGCAKGLEGCGALLFVAILLKIVAFSHAPTPPTN